MVVIAKTRADAFELVFGDDAEAINQSEINKLGVVTADCFDQTEAGIVCISEG